MSTLTVLKKKTLEFMQDNQKLFEIFESVFMFGSAINGNLKPNDIDLLLIYSVYCSEVVSNMECISYKLEEILHTPIHLTVLSSKELKDTNLLQKIKTHIKIK